jgi:hypothetical protein
VDLKAGRLKVMRALLELDGIPSGMDYFPAANDDQWTFFRKLLTSATITWSLLVPAMAPRLMMV